MNDGPGLYFENYFTMQIRYWVKTSIMMIMLFFVVYSIIQFEYKGIGVKDRKIVTIITSDCHMVFRGGRVCHAQVRDEKGLMFKGLSECKDYQIGEKATLVIKLGLFSRKERHYIYCD